MTADGRVRSLLDDLYERERPNAKSLIVTVFGDAILPHGGAVWLGSLVDLLAPCGVNERAVRTSVFRLTKDGWLTANQAGRRSYYALTPSARLRFAAAHQTIYAAGPRPWDGQWTMVLTGLVDAGTREPLRADLAWQGFGQLLPGVMVHPAPDEDALREALKGAGIKGGAPIMRATAEPWHHGKEARALVARAWDVDALAGLYKSFIEDFRPLARAVEQGATGPEQSYRLRTLLIHHYRRVLLREPGLPDELLPASWPGTAARILCRNLYRAVEASAEKHLAACLETPAGPSRRADPEYLARFGGLRRSLAERVGSS